MSTGCKMGRRTEMVATNAVWILLWAPADMIVVEESGCSPEGRRGRSNILV